MSNALRHRMQQLGHAVPERTSIERDQIWRNVATELNFRQSRSKSDRRRRLRFVSLMGVFVFAGLFVILQPLVSQPPYYLARPQYLEAASRKDANRNFA